MNLFEEHDLKKSPWYIGFHTDLATGCDPDGVPFTVKHDGGGNFSIVIGTKDNFRVMQLSFENLVHQAFTEAKATGPIYPHRGIEA